MMNAVRRALGPGLGIVLALGAGSALAAQPGQWTVRVGASHVSPNDDSDPVPGFGAGSGVAVDGATQLSFTVAYQLNTRWGVELLGALPFEHDIEGDGTISNVGDIGSTKHLPPTLSAQYHFAPTSQFQPYVGLGLNYTHFFDEEIDPSVSSSLDLDDSWGLAAQLGADVELGNNWLANADVRYIDIDTEGELGNGSTFDIEIDPWVFTLGVDRRF